MSNGLEQTATNLTRLRARLAERGLEGVIVTSQATLSWLFGGYFHVGLASEQGIATVFITRDHVACLVSNNEQNRLQDEEGLCADEWVVYPWYDESLKMNRLAEWAKQPGVVWEVEWLTELRALRSTFQLADLTWLRSAAVAAAAAAEQVCRTLAPDDTERAVAGIVANELIRSGLDPITVLVAGHERAQLYKHPLPTDASIGAHAIVSLCARVRGVVFSVTRMVAFHPADPGLLARHDAVARVDATLCAATRPGTALGDILSAGIAAYEAARIGSGDPFDTADAWRAHHQGGLAGYQSRELRATPTSRELVNVGQLYAWNPTLPGVKSEDTVWVGESDNEVLTYTGEFPMTDINLHGKVVQRPALLIRNPR